MRVLLLNQCFHPDVASTGQHLTDLAVGLAERGHEVTVVASRRGYDNPATRFAAREVWRGVNIIRIPSLHLGKGAKWRRALSFLSFLGSCSLRLLVLPCYDMILAMTTPPLISFLGALLTRLKGGRFVFWVMDLNPDEAIAAGWLQPQSVVARVLEAMLRFSLRHAVRVIVLDRFMQQRIVAKGVPEEPIAVIAPWSHSEAVQFEDRGRREFRQQHGLEEKYVVMYSGNHSPCHPLDTLLQAAQRLSSHPKIQFCFVGGGSEFGKVKAFAAERHLRNITCLPYQPLDQLSASLSAADLHVVVMGNPFVGIVHPCKIYNILTIGAPVLVIGPPESHLSDIVAGLDGAKVARHGDVETLVGHLLADAGATSLRRVAANQTLAARFSQAALLPRMIGELEGEAPAGSPAANITLRQPLHPEEAPPTT